MTIAITRRQRDVLEFIKSFIAERGYSPAQREIAASLNISRSLAFRFVEQLELRGAIRRETGARGIVVIIN